MIDPSKAVTPADLKFPIIIGNPASYYRWYLKDGEMHREWLAPIGYNMREVLIDPDTGDIYATTSCVEKEQ